MGFPKVVHYSYRKRRENSIKQGYLKKRIIFIDGKSFLQASESRNQNCSLFLQRGRILLERRNLNLLIIPIVKQGKSM